MQEKILSMVQRLTTSSTRPTSSAAKTLKNKTQITATTSTNERAPKNDKHYLTFRESKVGGAKDNPYNQFTKRKNSTNGTDGKPRQEPSKNMQTIQQLLSAAKAKNVPQKP